MTPKRSGLLAQAWFWWKTLRLPWRKRFFVGHDLNGNTYWEFRLTARGPRRGGEPWRRIVDYPRSTPYSEIKVSPLWHQWLRHARADAPSLAEQRHELLRQQRIKLLAAEADARWEAKPRFVVHPSADATSLAAPQMACFDQGHTTEARRDRPTKSEQPGEGKDDPWAQAKAHGPSANWQPAAWKPGKVPKKR